MCELTFSEFFIMLFTILWRLVEFKTFISSPHSYAKEEKGKEDQEEGVEEKEEVVSFSGDTASPDAPESVQRFGCFLFFVSKMSPSATPLGESASERIRTRSRARYEVREH